jgi:hypothetical protein
LPVCTGFRFRPPTRSLRRIAFTIDGPGQPNWRDRQERLTLDFQRAVLGRISKINVGPEKAWRDLLFVCDEYHTFAPRPIPTRLETKERLRSASRRR